MTLLGSTGSPYARKVRIVMIEKCIPHRWVEVATPHDRWVDGQLTTVWLPNLNWTAVNVHPLGQIPLLIHDEVVWYDSRVICEYLELIAPALDQSPCETLGLSVRQAEAIANEICDLVGLSWRLRRQNETSVGERETMASLVAVVQSLLGELERHPQCTTEALGPGLTLAQVGTAVALEYMDLRMSEVDWRAAHPVLERLHRSSSTRPSFLATNMKICRP